MLQQSTLSVLKQKHFASLELRHFENRSCIERKMWNISWNNITWFERMGEVYWNLTSHCMSQIKSVWNEIRHKVIFHIHDAYRIHSHRDYSIFKEKYIHNIIHNIFYIQKKDNVLFRYLHVCEIFNKNKRTLKIKIYGNWKVVNIP